MQIYTVDVKSNLEFGNHYSAIIHLMLARNTFIAECFQILQIVLQKSSVDTLSVVLWQDSRIRHEKSLIVNHLSPRPPNNITIICVEENTLMMNLRICLLEWLLCCGTFRCWMISIVSIIKDLIKYLPNVIERFCIHCLRCNTGNKRFWEILSADFIKHGQPFLRMHR